MVRRLHFFLFVAVIVLAPLPLGANRPWSWSLLSLSIGFLCLTWPLCVLFDRQHPGLPLRKVAGPFLMFGAVILWALLQASPVWPAAWADPLWLDARRLLPPPGPATVPLATDSLAVSTGIMRLLCYAGVMWLALQHGRVAWRAHRMIDMLALAGGAYALYGLLVFFTGNDSILMMTKWAYPESLTATFVNRNSFATYAGLSLLCAIAAILLRLPPPVRVRTLMLHIGRPTALFALAAFLLAAALVASGSRAGTVSALIGLCTLAFMRRVTRQAPGAPRWRTLGLAALAITMLMALTISTLIWAGALDGDFSDRRHVYALTLDLITGRPLTGHGPGSFAAIFATIRPPTILQVWTEAHDTYLELAVELGVPAAVTLVGAVLWLVGICVRGGAIRHRDALYPLLGVAATILVGFHALFDFSLQIPAVTVTWAAILGIGLGQSWRSGSGDRAGNRN